MSGYSTSSTRRSERTQSDPKEPRAGAPDWFYSRYNQVAHPSVFRLSLTSGLVSLEIEAFRPDAHGRLLTRAASSFRPSRNTPQATTGSPPRSGDHPRECRRLGADQKQSFGRHYPLRPLNYQLHSNRAACASDPVNRLPETIWSANSVDEVVAATEEPRVADAPLAA